MAKFEKKNGKWVRNNSDGTQTLVIRGKDNRFYWTLADGKKVRSKVYSFKNESKKSAWDKIKDGFVNATIGASVAEIPAVQTANGWQYNNGEWSLDPTTKGATQLRSDLAKIGTVGSIPLIVPAASTIIPTTLKTVGLALTPSTWIGGLFQASGTRAPAWLLNSADLGASAYFAKQAGEEIDKNGLNWKTGINGLLSLAPFTRDEQAINTAGTGLRSFFKKLGDVKLFNKTPIKVSTNIPINESQLERPATRIVSFDHPIENISTLRGNQTSINDGLTSTINSVETPIERTEILPTRNNDNIIIEPSIINNSDIINTPTSESSNITSSIPEEILEILRENGYTARPTKPRIFDSLFFYDKKTFDFNSNDPHTWMIKDKQLVKLNLLNPEDLRKAIKYPNFIDDTKADIYRGHPYTLEYNFDKPFTKETLPGIDRTDLIEGIDVTDMSHFNYNPILNNDGYMVGSTRRLKDSDGNVLFEIPYSKKMIDEFNHIPHGASVGFISGTSTSSTPMFWLLLRKGLSNKTIARVYIPNSHSSHYRLNHFGRAYKLNGRGRMISVPGTEGDAFSIIHKPEYKGSKTIKYTKPDGSTINVVLLPNGKYIDGFSETDNISEAIPSYYYNGSIYRDNGEDYLHKVLYSVDEPFLTKEEYVDHLNKEYIIPTLKSAGLELKNLAKIDEYGDVIVPNIAGIKYKYGGSIIDKFRKWRKH